MWLAGLFVLLALPTVLVAQTWVELTPDTTPYGAPPDPYFGVKPVHYDETNNRLIVFFGSKAYGNQVWILTNANGLGGTPTWIKLMPSGQAPASNGSETVVYDPITNRLIVYGGCYWNCSPALADVFVLTNANGLGGDPVWTWIAVTNPQQRVDHSSVYDPLSNRMISFAGHFAFFGTDQNDTRILSDANGLGGTSGWTTLATSGSPPGIRCDHTAVYDQATNRMTIFAGTNLVHTCCPYDQDDYNDVWVLSEANGWGGLPTWVQLTPAGGPPALRSSHSAVYDPMNNRMLIFGGATWSDAAQNGTPLGDLWQLSYANGLGGAPTWTELIPSGTAPGPRFMHTAAFDAAHQRMIVFGGRNDNEIPPTCNRVWVLILEQAVTIDIKPGSSPNSINMDDQGLLPVAILGDEEFDVATIDPQTVNVGGVSLASRGSAKAPKLAYSHEDVNSDGFMDMMVFFDVQTLVAEQILTESTIALEISGSLHDGTPIKGSDLVSIVH